MRPLAFFFDNPASGEGGFGQKFNRFFAWLVHVVFRLLFRYEPSGVENTLQFTGTGALLAGNHRSYLDPLFMMGALRPRAIRFMGKEEFFELNPLLSRLAAWVGAFPVKRGTADMTAVKRSIRMLRRGELVGIFPEATRIRSPEQEVIYHEGVALIAAMADAPVIPVRIWNADQICPPGKRFFQRPKITLRFGEALYITDEPFASMPKNQRYREFTEEVMRRIYALEPLPEVPQTSDASNAHKTTDLADDTTPAAEQVAGQAAGQAADTVLDTTAATSALTSAPTNAPASAPASIPTSAPTNLLNINPDVNLDDPRPSDAD
jgi:1-acyl-sn-glycerol-3-phosphate acyltransferase